MKKLLKTFTLAAVLAAVAFTGASAVADETQKERDERMAWWREARLGMFIQ